jgi:hypothetical protein
VSSELEYDWNNDLSLRLGGEPHTFSWVEVSQTLRAIDTTRRGSLIRPGQTSGLPLGYSVRGDGGGQGGGPSAAAASSSQPQPSGRPESPSGSPKKTKGKGKGKGGAPRDASGKSILVCFIRSCHGSHAWIHCPKLKAIREQKGKDWSPSAADREAALLIAENKALRARVAQAEGGDEAGASVARAGLTVASGGSLTPGTPPAGASGTPTTSARGHQDPDLVPRSVRLGPRLRLETERARGRAPTPGQETPPAEGGGPPVL